MGLILFNNAHWLTAGQWRLIKRSWPSCLHRTLYIFFIQCKSWPVTFVKGELCPTFAIVQVIKTYHCTVWRFFYWHRWRGAGGLGEGSETRLFDFSNRITAFTELQRTSCNTIISTANDNNRKSYEVLERSRIFSFHLKFSVVKDIQVSLS